jgi:hypothetical protein
MAAAAAICARVEGLCSALLLRKAPATEREFNALRTARELVFLFRLALTPARR